MNVYIICPVRHRTPGQNLLLESHVRALRANGHSVFLPGEDRFLEEAPRNVCGIILRNIQHIAAADYVHVLYGDNTTWSLFDFGIAVAYHKPIVPINPVVIKGAAERGDAYALALQQLAWSLP